MRILALDPSGSYNEGKGKTGWLVLNDWRIETFGQLKATDYNSREEYWHAHKELITKLTPDDIAAEQFVLYRTKASSQINSEMETSKLLGYIEMITWDTHTPFTAQLAAQAKTRFKDKILIYKNYIIKDKNGRYYINGVNVSDHIIDALRHALLRRLTIAKREVKQNEPARQT